MRVSVLLPWEVRYDTTCRRSPWRAARRLCRRFLLEKNHTVDVVVRGTGARGKPRAYVRGWRRLRPSLSEMPVVHVALVGGGVVVAPSLVVRDLRGGLMLLSLPRTLRSAASASGIIGPATDAYRSWLRTFDRRPFFSCRYTREPLRAPCSLVLL